jgi:type I restriction enzyme S subunit
VKPARIEDLAVSISSGITPLRSNPEFWNEGNIPWLKTEQLGEKDIYKTNEYISEVALSKTSIKLNPRNTLSMAMYGEGKTRGNVSILRQPMTTNQACCNIVLDEALADVEYVYYSLKNQYSNLRNLSSGVRKNLNSGDIKGFAIALPETLPDQQKIAKVLSTLDAKIELNNRINAELEAMAKLLYDYWFVQFDFPMTAEQAAALGQPHLEGQPYKSSGGKMVFNETLKREIPEGWRGDNIMALSKLGGGGTPSKTRPEYWNGEIPFFTPTDAKPEPFLLKTEDYITKEGHEKSSTRVYPAGTLFLTARGSVGKVMITSAKMAMSQSCYALVPNEGVSSQFLYFHFQRLIHYLKVKSSGSVFKSIVTNDIEFSPMVIPDTSILENFNAITNPMFEKILNNQKQNQELTQLRDWLLPMLMNGQVTVE